MNNAPNTPNNNEATAAEFPTVYAIKMVGHLGHDNKLFDRTCAQCGGTKYSSKLVQNCPKCGQPLTVTLTQGGKPMAISEGTMYPSFWPKQKARDTQAIANRKNGMRPMYRFKLFSFADENGVLAPPTDHYRMLKGAQVELLAINHSLVPSWYQSKKDGEVRVELMIHIYPQYGDKVTILKAPQAAEKTTAVPTDAAGNHVTPDVSTMQATIDALNAKIASMESAAGDEFTPVDGGFNPTEAAEDMEPPMEDYTDPFNGV